MRARSIPTGPSSLCAHLSAAPTGLSRRPLTPCVAQGNATIADDSPMRTAWVFDSTSGTPKKLINAKLGPLGPNGEEHPWRAPGTAPTYAPCGIDGGNPLGCPPGNPSLYGCDGGGYAHGYDSRTLPSGLHHTEWSVPITPPISRR